MQIKIYVCVCVSECIDILYAQHCNVFEVIFFFPSPDKKRRNIRKIYKTFNLKNSRRKSDVNAMDFIFDLHKGFKSLKLL